MIGPVTIRVDKLDFAGSQIDWKGSQNYWLYSESISSQSINLIGILFFNAKNYYFVSFLI